MLDLKPQLYYDVPLRRVILTSEQIRLVKQKLEHIASYANDGGVKAHLARVALDALEILKGNDK